MITQSETVFWAVIYQRLRILSQPVPQSWWRSQGFDLRKEHLNETMCVITTIVIISKQFGGCKVG